MRIAQVVTRMDWGGPPDIIRTICKSLAPPHEVKLITGPTAFPSLRTKSFLYEFKDSVITVPHLKRDIDLFRDFLALAELYRIFKKEKFDVVHTHTAKAGFLGRIAAWLAGARRIVHTPHGHNFYGYFGRAASRLLVILERLAARITDRIIVLTESEKRDLINHKVAGAADILVIDSGVDIEACMQVDIDPGKKRDELRAGRDTALVGMIGRLEPVKGPEYLVRAARLVLDEYRRVKFMIVGEGSLRDRLETLCREARISDRFVFTGWREDIPEILSVLDIVVMPSLNEAVGRVLIEAGACGKPVVAANVGGIPDIVRDRQTGMLVPPGDEVSLSRAVVDLLGDSEKRQRMGEEARRWVRRFSSARMAREFAGVYEGLTGE
ncbi:MAG: glycosyltransferase family 4 protein [Deferribacteres bacterium]|nr:glycosyltransferase family 4 protein [Deferribacteres bacterium]